MGVAKKPEDSSNVERLRCLVHMILLVALTPVSMLMAVIWGLDAALLRRKAKDPFQSDQDHEATPSDGFGVPFQQRTVLITGGKMAKALHFARCVWKAGHRVVLTEVRGCIGSRFSRAVTAFEEVTDPLEDKEAYITDMKRVAEKYNVDVFLPVPAAVHAIADACVGEELEKMGVRNMHFGVSEIRELDCKHSFGTRLRELGLSAPETFRVTSDAEVRGLNKQLLTLEEESSAVDDPSHKSPRRLFVLKNLEYDALHRLDLFTLPCPSARLDEYLAKLKSDGTPISEKLPWQLQEFVRGKEYTAMAVLRRSELRMVTVSASSPSQLNYVHENSRVTQLVEDWLLKWVATLPKNLDAQVCFDFIYDADSDSVKVLECNPRAHSQSCVFNSDDEQLALGRVLVDDQAHPSRRRGVLRPTSGARMFWFTNELFKLALPQGFFFRYRDPHYASGGMRGFLRRVFLAEKDSDFDAADPLPFILRTHYQIPALLCDTFYSGNRWEKVDFCIGKMVE